MSEQDELKVLASQVKELGEKRWNLALKLGGGLVVLLLAILGWVANLYERDIRVNAIALVEANNRISSLEARVEDMAMFRSQVVGWLVNKLNRPPNTKDAMRMDKETPYQ